MTQPTTDEYLCRDVFPAEVSMPDGTLHRTVRAFVTSHRLLVWARGASGVAIVVDEPLSDEGAVTSQRRGGRDHIEAPLAAGTAHVNAMTGCGCQNKVLRALAIPVPWPRTIRA